MHDRWVRFKDRWVHDGPGPLFLYGLPLLVFLIARLTLRNYYEFETAEDTHWARIIVEKGELPLYGIGHIRFLSASLGPLIYYMKAIPYAFSPDPGLELAFLLMIHAASVVFVVGLGKAWFEDLLHEANDPWTSRIKDHFQGIEGRTAAWAGWGMGMLYALSMHSMLLCSHGHGMYYAAGFMPPFLFFLYRFLREGGTGNIIALGAIFGVMSQTYQLTLFIPGLVALLFLAFRRWPNRREWTLGLIALAITYLPYILSEMFTGFSNTRGLFRLEPGEGDKVLVQGQYLLNWLYVLNSFVEYRFLPWGGELVFLLLGATGLLWAFGAALMSRTMRFPVIFFLYYVVLPAFVLDAPRIQLARPAMQWLIVLGLLPWSLWIARTWTSGTTLRRAAGVGLFLALIAGTAWIESQSLDDLLYGSIDYPSRIALMDPVGDTPDLSESKHILQTLHDEFSVRVNNLASTVFSPFMVTGFYGHNYLLRLYDPPGTASDPTQPPPVLVVDRWFPYRIVSHHEAWIDDVQIAGIDPQRLPLDQFTLEIECDRPWCSKRTGVHPSKPLIRYFGGCEVFRSLDDRLSVPKAQCEDLIGAPKHNRRYLGTMNLPARTQEFRQAKEVLWVAAEVDCDITILASNVPLKAKSHRVTNLQFLFYDVTDLPREVPLELSVSVENCRPEMFEMVQFTGMPREPYSNEQ